MANANKAKGTHWESALRDYFRDLGIKAYRPAQEGRGDVGDLHGLTPFVGQAKNWKDVVAALRVGTESVQEQAQRARETYGVNFVKRRMAGVDRGYAVMTVATFAQVLLRLRSAEQHLAALNFDVYVEHLDEHGGK